MNIPAFSLRLSLISLLSGLALFVLHQYPPFEVEPELDWLLLILYIALSILFFVLGKRSARASHPAAFSRFFLSSIFIKLFSSLSLILFYVETVKPEGKYYVLPFLFIYSIYTIFEVYFLSKISKHG